VIFQDFTGPGILKKKSRAFQEAWEPCTTEAKYKPTTEHNQNGNVNECGVS